MSDLNLINLFDATISMAPGRRMVQAIIDEMEKHKDNPEMQDLVMRRIGPFMTCYAFLEKQAIQNISTPTFVPTVENVCMFFDYTVGVGWSFVTMPLLKDEILYAAINSADIDPWFYDLVSKPSLPDQPLWPTVQMQMMLHIGQAALLGKALLEEVTLRIPELLEN